MALFPGLPRWAGTRRQNQSGFNWSKRQWVAVASAGPYASLHLAPDRQPCQHPTTQFFTGWMPFLPPNQQHQSTEGKRTDWQWDINPILYRLSSSLWTVSTHYQPDYNFWEIPVFVFQFLFSILSVAACQVSGAHSAQTVSAPLVSAGYSQGPS